MTLAPQGARAAASAALAACVAFGAVSCGTASPVPTGAAPVDPLTLATIADLNPSPDIVEINLTAREAERDLGGAKPTRVYTYNGTLPGPLVDAKVGDELIVHFKNELPEPTLVHWHGVRLPAAMDGSPSVQPPVKPGGTFEYRFRLKDAGLFWFHPHVRSDFQQEHGLVGVIRVRAPEEPRVDQERVVILDDVRVNEDGTFPTYLDDAAKMLGRESETLMVNGVRGARLRSRPGALQRLRILNAANGRFFNLKLAGTRLRVIGTDGGRIPEPYDVDSLLIAPSERYDVVFRAPSSAGEFPITTEPYDRGHETGENPARRLGVLVVEGQQVEAQLPSIDHGPALPKLAAPTNTAPITFSLDEGTTPSGELTFLINGKAWPEVPMQKMALAEVRTLELINLSEMDHPFHVHGTFFQVLSTNGVPAARIVNKDTVIVPMKGRVTALVKFDEPGAWMVHCHINEHAENGMMGEIHVGDATSLHGSK